MKTVIITGYTAKSEGVILQTNIPARLKPNRMPSKETFVSWDKIGNLLFEDYTQLEGVSIRESINNNSSLKEESEKQYCMPDEVNTREEHEQYLKDIGLSKNKTIFEWADLFQDNIQSGTSQSNIIQLLMDFKEEQGFL